MKLEYLSFDLPALMTEDIPFEIKGQVAGIDVVGVAHLVAGNYRNLERYEGTPHY